VVTLPLLAVGVILTVALPGVVDARQDRGLTASARITGEVLDELCGRARAAAELTARTVVAAPAGSLPAALEGIRDRGLADAVAVVDASGQLVASAGLTPAGPASEDCTDGAVVVDAEGGTWIAAIAGLARPVVGAEPRPQGAAIAAFGVDDKLALRLKATLGSGEVVLLSGGRPVASSAPVPFRVLSAARAAGNDEPTTDGDTLAILHEPRPMEPVGVLLTTPRGDRTAILLPLLLLTGVCALVATGIAVLLARATSRPIEELNEAALRVASGDLSRTLPVNERDELGQLAGNLNAVTHELRGYVGALQQSRSEVQATVARLGDALSGTHDLDRLLEIVLETALASTGARAGAVLLVRGEALEVVVGDGLAARGVPDDLRVPVGEGILGGVARTGLPVSGYVDAAMRPLAGEPREIELAAMPLVRSGAVVGVLALFDRDGPFSEQDLATLRTLAGQATAAVDNVLLHEETRRQSLTDGLTGLWNYRYFQMSVSKELERAARFHRPLALLMLDLDRFKVVNDTFGHQRGDAVLVELAERLRGQVRDVDLLARYGGEEFVVVLPETDEAGAVQVAERIRQSVAGSPFGADGQGPSGSPLQLTVSIGIAVFPAHGDTPATLLRRADDALYTAKREGRDALRVAPPELPLQSRAGPPS